MRLRLDFSYDGRNFHGSQRQKQHRTVQADMETGLEILYQQPIRLHLSGRTDTGVHAIQQVAHYESPQAIPVERVKYALGNLLPSDIQLLDVKPVDHDFHARYSALAKSYQYILTSEDQVFDRPYKVYVPEVLDFDALDRAINYLVGEHDFYSFSNRRKHEDSTVRKLYAISYHTEGLDTRFTFYGNGFLYKMVRILMQYLVEVGRGRLDPERTPEILQARSREFTRKVFPAQGLYLKSVEYPNEYVQEKPSKALTSSL